MGIIKLFPFDVISLSLKFQNIWAKNATSRAFRILLHTQVWTRHSSYHTAKKRGGASAKILFHFFSVLWYFRCCMEEQKIMWILRSLKQSLDRLKSTSTNQRPEDMLACAITYSWHTPSVPWSVEWRSWSIRTVQKPARRTCCISWWSLRRRSRASKLCRSAFSGKRSGRIRVSWCGSIPAGCSSTPRWRSSFWRSTGSWRPWASELPLELTNLR